MYVGLVEPLVGIDLMFGTRYSATCKLKYQPPDEEKVKRLSMFYKFSAFMMLAMSMKNADILINCIEHVNESKHIMRFSTFNFSSPNFRLYSYINE